jgi:aryl-alcohol dehydrogenase-like predicted oxidoreductase
MFVIDKIDHHDQPVAPQLDGSLRRLGLDRVDLAVFHSASSVEGWAQLKAPGGGCQQLEDCRRQGKCRFVGISSHDPDVLSDAIEGGLVDVVLFPVGPYVDRRFVDEVLPLAKRRGVGTVCFKTFGGGKLLGDTEGYSRPLSARPRGKVSSGGEDQADPRLPRLSVRQCLHYTLTLDPDVALLGLSFPNEQDAALAAAADFESLGADQMRRIEQLAAQAVQDKGRCWWNPQPAP